MRYRRESQNLEMKMADGLHPSPTPSGQRSNPHALDDAQDPEERLEIMIPPPSPSSESSSPPFDPYADVPTSTGTYATREIVHRCGMWHSTAHVWIIDPSASSVLLQRRSMAKDTFPGRWDISSAGHVGASSGGPTRTAMSELAEELGMDDVNESELDLAFIIPAEQASMGGCNAYEHVYFLVRDGMGGGETLSLGEAEVSEVAWKPAKEVLDALRKGDGGYAPRTAGYVDAMEGELDKITGRWLRKTGGSR
jgi:isopentenyldiphosphate isomerase